jgi:hypothetical protein
MIIIFITSPLINIIKTIIRPIVIIITTKFIIVIKWQQLISQLNLITNQFFLF